MHTAVLASEIDKSTVIRITDRSSPSGRCPIKRGAVHLLVADASLQESPDSGSRAKFKPYRITLLALALAHRRDRAMVAAMLSGSRLEDNGAFMNLSIGGLPYLGQMHK